MSLSARAIASWDANAAYWDAAIGPDGNKYWRRLQEPSLARLLGRHLRGGGRSPARRALDLATGNGLCARWLARSGAASVLATDASAAMLDVARARVGDGDEEDGKIAFRKVDVTSEADLDALVAEEAPFDVVLMNMAIMDVATLEPLARALPRLLADGGV